MSKSKGEEIVSFDVLLKSKKAGVEASTQTLEKIRPPAEAGQRALRWLEQQGVRCHDLEYSLACQAPRALFEKLFAVTLKEHKTPGGVAWKPSSTPVIPMAIAEWVEEVTIAPPPEYFGS
jgi:hypothetical protein